MTSLSSKKKTFVIRASLDMTGMAKCPPGCPKSCLLIANQRPDFLRIGLIVPWSGFGCSPGWFSLFFTNHVIQWTGMKTPKLFRCHQASFLMTKTTQIIVFILSYLFPIWNQYRLPSNCSFVSHFNRLGFLSFLKLVILNHDKILVLIPDF